MSKELEALENLAKNVEGSEEYRFEHYKSDYNLIKSALKRNEKLEIIEKHPISYYLLKYNADIKNFTYKDYLRCVGKDIKEMNFWQETLCTETEFNLLKEMLNEKH